MDLTIPFENTILNIRVAIILQTSNGYVLGRGENKNYYHFVGRRVKLGENSLQAAKREILEEAGVEIKNFEFVSIIENFWQEKEKNNKVQEICFVYKTNIVEKIFPNINLKESTKEEMKDMDIRPEIIKEILLQENGNENNITHHIV